LEQYMTCGRRYNRVSTLTLFST